MTIYRLLAILLVVLLRTRIAHAQSSACLAPGDSSRAQITVVRELLRATTPSTLTLRTKLGLVGLDTADMQLVQDEAVCARVDSAMFVPDAPQTLLPYVIYALGTTRFAVFSPGPHYTAVYIVDDQKKILTIIAAGGEG